METLHSLQKHTRLHSILKTKKMKNYHKNKKTEMSFSYEALTTITCLLIISIIMLFINSGILDIQKETSQNQLSSGTGTEISTIKTFLNLPTNKQTKIKDIIISSTYDTKNNEYSFEKTLKTQKKEYLTKLGITDQSNYLNWKILDTKNTQLSSCLNLKNFCQPILLEHIEKIFILCYKTTECLNAQTNFGDEQGII